MRRMDALDGGEGDRSLLVVGVTDYYPKKGRTEEQKRFNVALSKARERGHFAFDLLWRHGDSRRMDRVEAYAWLAEGLGVPPDQCHFSMFSLAQCERVLELLRERRRTRG